jgi:hypothetical protein
MSDFEIDFENEVGRYEIEPATAAEVARRRAQDPKDMQGMSDEAAAFYCGDLVRKGDFRTIRISSEKLEKSVRVLVECKQTPFHKVALAVANTIGYWDGDRNPVRKWRQMADKLRMMFEGKAYDWSERSRPAKQVEWPHPAAQHIGDLGIFLVPHKDGKPVLALRPHDFQDALILCAARTIATGTTLGTCLHCQTLFLRGGEKRSKRRGDARFCSDPCKWGYHNEVRRKAARKRKL